MAANPLKAGTELYDTADCVPLLHSGAVASCDTHLTEASTVGEGDSFPSSAQAIELLPEGG